MNMRSQTMMTKATRILTLALLMFASVASAATSLTSISGLRVWLDGSDASTLFKDADGTAQVSANGDQVALWRDKSGNNNHAVAWVGPTSSPTYTASALGGKSALTFNGSQGLSNGTYAWSSSVNIFAVVSANSWSSANGYRFILSSMPATYNAGIALTGGAYDGWNANEVLAYGNNWVSEPTPSTPRVNAPYGTLSNGQAAILDVSLSDSVADIALNGSLLTPTYRSINNEVFAKNGYNVAGKEDRDQAWQGNIAELVIFDRVLSDSEANEVGSYLQDKYGITGAYALIPEPSSLGLLLLGGGAVLLLRRRR